MPPNRGRAARGAGPAAHDPAHDPDFATRLASGCEQLGLTVSAAQIAALCRFASLLLRWNRVHNLTAIRDPRQLLSHHLLDSLSIVRPLEAALAAWRPHAAPPRGLDVGSGGGLPAIPLAVLRPAWKLDLIDAVEKKCAFLRQAQLEAALSGITVHHGRVESLPPRGCDFIVCRAFASLREFTALTAAHLAPGGLWFAMKGSHPAAELADLPPGHELLEAITLRVPMLAEQRTLIVLRPRP